MVGSHRYFLIPLFLLCFSIPLAGASTVNEGLLGLEGSGTFPFVPSIGQLEDPTRPNHPAVASVYTALNDFYRPDWFERHVYRASIFALSRMHDQRLASTLPATVAIGRARVSSDHVYVPVLILQTEGEDEVWDLILIEDSKGNWRISSLTIP